MLSDLESLERRTDGLEKRIRGTDKEAQEARETLDLVKRALVLLHDGKPARLLQRTEGGEKAFRMLALLTAIPVLYGCNVAEDALAKGDPVGQEVGDRGKAAGSGCVSIVAK